VGVANADEVEVERNYTTRAACEADGPHVEITHDNGLYSLGSAARVATDSGTCSANNG
jgi:hypothetical protein